MMIGHRYMTKKLLIVKLSSDTTTKEMKSKSLNKKKSIKNIIFFVFLVHRIRTCTIRVFRYSSILYALGWLS